MILLLLIFHPDLCPTPVQILATQSYQQAVGSASGAWALNFKMQLALEGVNAMYCFVNEYLYLLWDSFHVE